MDPEDKAQAREVMAQSQRTAPPHGDALVAMWRRGVEHWPALAVPEADFVAWLGARLGELDPATLVAEDLFLACAALTRVPGASEALVGRFRSELERHALKVLDEDLADELIQELLVDLLTGTDERAPRLEQYSGRGPLRVWLRMAVTRRALNMRRRRDPRGLDIASSQVMASLDTVADRALDDDPEMAVMRRTHRAAMSEIFAMAIGEIAADDRTLLKLHYGEGSTLNELALLHQTSRSAMHRRLEKARSRLLERLAELVGERLSLSESERRSVMRLFVSDLRDSLGRLLR